MVKLDTLQLCDTGQQGPYASFVFVIFLLACVHSGTIRRTFRVRKTIKNAKKLRKLQMTSPASFTRAGLLIHMHQSAVLHNTMLWRILYHAMPY